jgi:hypothetical protein
LGSRGSGQCVDSSFDTLDHERLREILSRRVRDGVILRLIGKWLKAGVMEGLVLSHPEAGTPLRIATCYAVATGMKIGGPLCGSGEGGAQ